MAIQNPKNQNSLNLFFNNYFNIILAALLVIFLLVFYFLFLVPKYQTTLAAIKDSISQKQLLYDAQNKKLADLQTISSLYKKIDVNDLKKFNNVLSDDYVKESLFGEIEEIVSQNGFIVNSIGITRFGEEKANAAPKVQPSSLGSNLGEIDITLAISAIDYASFKNLVKTFETNLRLMDISQISFSATDSAASLTLRTYYYKQN